MTVVGVLQALDESDDKKRAFGGAGVERLEGSTSKLYPDKV